jgi:hypothetical protein
MTSSIGLLEGSWQAYAARTLPDADPATALHVRHGYYAGAAVALMVVDMVADPDVPPEALNAALASIAAELTGLGDEIEAGRA